MPRKPICVQMAQQPTEAFIPLKSSPWPGKEHEEANMETGKSVAQKLVPFTLATALMIFLLIDEKRYQIPSLLFHLCLPLDSMVGGELRLQWD